MLSRFYYDYLRKTKEFEIKRCQLNKVLTDFCEDTFLKQVTLDDMRKTHNVDGIQMLQLSKICEEDNHYTKQGYGQPTHCYIHCSTKPIQNRNCCNNRNAGSYTYNQSSEYGLNKK